LLASGLGLGYVPWASGTFGSLLGIPLYLAGRPLWRSAAVAVVVLAVAIGAACWIADQAERILGEHDSGKIVIDEVIGMVLALLWHPTTPLRVLALFCLFRLFDVWKPWPARTLERAAPGGLGVVLDDVASGLYANLAGHILVWALR
jgi:phosphatidylglycerophosphatase A